MRRCGVALCVLLASAALRALCAQPDTGPGEGNVELLVTGALPGGDEGADAALRELVALGLRRAGVGARPVRPPAACEAGPRDARACRDATLAALAAARVHVAVVPVRAAAAPAAWLLRDYGLVEVGDVAPPARRACLAPYGAARSLLDLADADIARQYSATRAALDAALPAPPAPPAGTRSSFEFYAPEWCVGENSTCALALTSDEGEAAVLLAAARGLRLHLRVAPLGQRLAAVAAALGPRGPLLCDWTPDTSHFAHIHTAHQLGPPPCAAAPNDTGELSECPFESVRLIKFANGQALARSTAAVRALVRLRLESSELQELGARARGAGGAAGAARDLLAAHPGAVRLSEVRVGVLVPRTSPRDAYDALALAAAAALAEDEPSGARWRYKVELADDHCDVRHAYRYLFRALGTGEYGALSALAGPACGAPFADVARQSSTHLLPVLAYSPQAPPEPPDAPVLLAAGDARDVPAALAALARRVGWRRAAVLSEPATRPAVDALRPHLALAAHLELPAELADDGGDDHHFHEWARRAAAAEARVLWVCVEDARAVRAALCAARAAGLAPAPAGRVWLLPAALPARWLLPTPTDAHNCTAGQLAEVAHGHLSLAPVWMAEWRGETSAAPSDAWAARRARWTERWRVQCARFARRAVGAVGAGGRAACGGTPGPLAALLYDALRLWAEALARTLHGSPHALADLHAPQLVTALVENATEAQFTGLTGRFEWRAAGAGRARTAPLVLLQWERGRRREVGRWAPGSDSMELGAALHWPTADGTPPGDGGADDCALRPLAALLGVDCHAAGVALAALLLALTMAALAGAALHCKRRAEHEYRRRLAALGLRPLQEPQGLDRWEVPRERVVINRKLGTGAFGTVYGGHALLDEGRGWTAVAVKTLKVGATTDEKLDFLSEAETMKRFDHKNIVRLLGVVTKTEPVCTVMEFMLYGDLKSYLLARRHLARSGECVEGEEGGAGDEASPRRLTGMALDAARALSYLAQRRYVHRDVAARNCLVSARRALKLADFGMTRLVFEHDYYRFSRKGLLPVRWMAPESLALGVFSPASDVWSFGVLLYEIVTFGSLPFQGLSNSEVLTRVKAGHTLDLPPGLKPQLEGLIKSCWQQEHRARPTAAEVAALLADCPRLLTPCLDVPLDALSLSLDGEPPWHLPPDRAEARWVSWAAPASAATDTTYLSSEAPAPAPAESDRFLP